jgi:hypothetical protein
MSSIDYKKLLDDALKLEGKLSDCYSMFHHYSFNNQILAMVQVGAQPINTYKGWQALERQVKKGAKAIELCMPVTIKDKETEEVKTIFMFRKNWFGIDQTEGKEFQVPVIPNFNRERVLANLKTSITAFESADGNTQGYTDGKTISINPVAKYPLKTLWHELGHFVIGHVGNDTGTLTRSIAEVEAETVAYILCNIFKYEAPMVESRGYIQHWNDNEGISADSAKSIFKAVQAILNANKETTK